MSLASPDTEPAAARHAAAHLLDLDADAAVAVRAARPRGRAGAGLVPAGRPHGAHREGAQAGGRAAGTESDGKAPRRVGEAARKLNRRVVGSLQTQLVGPMRGLPFVTSA